MRGKVGVWGCKKYVWKRVERSAGVWESVMGGGKT